MVKRALPQVVTSATWDSRYASSADWPHVGNNSAREWDIFAYMVTREQINAAVRILAEAARPARIVLFGSHARGDAREDSDVDLLVIEPRVDDRAREMVRLRRLLRPLRIPVDILVYSAEDVARWGKQPGSALYWALREGTVVHG